MSKTIINGIDVSEEIIIDDVNVTECKYLICDRPHNCECKAECTIYPETEIYDVCKGNNCYFKQFKRLQGENEELKEKNKNYAMLMLEQQVLSQNYWECIEKTKQAIEVMAETCNAYSQKTNLDKLITTINEVLNG